jgi:hypothetical protein
MVEGEGIDGEAFRQTYKHNLAQKNPGQVYLGRAIIPVDG